MLVTGWSIEMPLIRGKSKKTIGQNIEELINAGHARDQAVAIALKMAGKGKGKNGKRDTRRK